MKYLILILFSLNAYAGLSECKINEKPYLNLYLGNNINESMAPIQYLKKNHPNIHVMPKSSGIFSAFWLNDMDLYFTADSFCKYDYKPWVSSEPQLQCYIETKLRDVVNFKDVYINIEEI